jgi:hypothetical protein
MDDFVHCVVMILVGGISGAKGTVGWRAKALDGRRRSRKGR